MPSAADRVCSARDALLAAIAAADRGLLGVVAVADHDRLAAFDPALAERVGQVVADRLARMVGGRRPTAMLDRARIAVWFGELPGSEAEAELAAIGYALADAIEMPGGGSLVPEIATARAAWPNDAADPAALLDRAIAALALGAGEGLAAATAATRDRYLLEQDLRQAVDRGDFHLAFQPLVDAAAGTVVGAEALLRWRHPQRGLVSPAEFIPVAEAMGLADAVGGWALNAACREAARWPALGLDARVAVNVSAAQLAGGDFRRTIARTLDRHALAPHRLELELTESVATADPVRTAALFDDLRGHGIRIAVDDFGTGFSSLGALRRLRFDKLKIDREFVAQVDHRRDSQAICRALLALADGLGLAVLAEGVERYEEYAWLAAQGCRLFQGFYFARPLDPAAFIDFAGDDIGLAVLLGRGNDRLSAVG